MFEQVREELLGEIGNISQTKRSRKYEYRDPFFYHLDSLKQFEFASPNFSVNSSEESGVFKVNDYLGLEQYVFNNTEVLEAVKPNPIDWDVVDNLKDILNDRINKLLSNEKNSEVLKPVINYTIDAFERYVIYQQMHPKSFYNPYYSTHEMLKDGYLYLIDNKNDLIKEFDTKVDTIDLENDNIDLVDDSIGILTKAKNEKQFRTVVLDKRFKLQKLVLDYLSVNAAGYDEAKSKSKIRKHLQNNNVNINLSNLNSRALLPLKRVGLIGSSSNGFYYIYSEKDLRKAFEFHKSKYFAIRKTLDIYNLKARSKNIKLDEY